MNIFIVIPVHNRRTTTRECLSSLFAQESQNFLVIVVDDGSTDGTSEMIMCDFPQVVLLRGDGNLWWTGAMNKGIKHALKICTDQDCILALNDDLTLPKNYISNLKKLKTQHPGTLIGSVIVDCNDQDTILSGGIKINWANAKRYNLDEGKKLSGYPKGYSHQVSTLTGRGVLIPGKVFQEIGLYNASHYRHYGDTELPKRAEMAGYKLIVSYDAIVYSGPLKKNNISQDGSYKLKDIRNYFWSIYSNTDLRNRFWFAYDTTPNIFHGTVYLIFDFLRITYHYFSRVKLLK